MSQSSYPPGGYPPKDTSSSTIIWVVVLVLVLVIGLPIVLVAVMFLGCCGVIGWGTYAAVQMTGDMAKQQYANDPVIQQHIGEIQSISPNFTATSEEQQKQPGATASIIVFDVSGPKGSGQLIAEQEPGGQPGKMFSKARLRTSAGEFPLSQ